VLEPDFFLARWFFEDVRFTADLGVSGGQPANPST
jgi:hypothetical protein